MDIEHHEHEVPNSDGGQFDVQQFDVVVIGAKGEVVAA